MATRIFQIALSSAIKAQGQYREVSAHHAYVLAGSFEEALGKFRKTYPDADPLIRGISLVDYTNGLPVIQ